MGASFGKMKTGEGTVILKGGAVSLHASCTVVLRATFPLKKTDQVRPSILLSNG